MKKRILGVNGIHNCSRSKKSFTDDFLKALEKKYTVIDVKYPYMLAILAYLKHSIKRRAKMLYEQSREGDVVIAHSFGCIATIEAMKLGARYSKVFFFASAAERDVYIPSYGYERIWNIYSTSDATLTLGSLFPFHPFGKMGQRGYNGKAANLLNVPAEGYQHGDYVKEQNFATWVSFIEDRVGL